MTSTARNVTNLPPFLYSLRWQGVPLPEELKNEPYSYEDNGLRPEIRGMTRPRFGFGIHSDDGTPNCYVGREVVTSQEESLGRPRYELPKKRQTTISAVNVYDAYGLDVTRSFLEYLYYNKYNAEYPSWLAVYLYGSLCVVKPEILDTMEYETSKYGVLYLCSMLLLELTQTDAKQPKMLGELTTVEQHLPEEVLNKILDSTRLSNAMTRSLVASRCSEVPTEEELSNVHVEVGHYQNVTRQADGSYVNMAELPDGNIGEVIVKRLGRTVEVVINNYDDEPWVDEGGVVVKYDPMDYIAVYTVRGCDLEQSMLSWLTGLRREVYTMNIEDLQAWTAAFAIYNIGDQETTRTEFTEDELRNELSRLITHYIEHYII